MAAPDSGDPVEQRQFRVGVGRHVTHGKIDVDERPSQREVGHNREHHLSHRQRPSHGLPPLSLGGHPGQRGHTLHQRQARSQAQCKMTQLRNHASTAGMQLVPALSFNESTSSGGM